MSDSFSYDLCVVGGCGRVGLPLAIAFASKGLKVAVHDLDNRAVETVRSGKMPFQEEGADPLLATAIENGRLDVANNPDMIRAARAVIVVIGTPVDEHLNPMFSTLSKLFEQLSAHMCDGQLLVLRSTLYPGTTDKIARFLLGRGLHVKVSFCPERIAEGRAIEELEKLPQIVSGHSAEAREEARKLFSHLTSDVVELEPFEAELAKLFTNSWRYIQFATANQFYMMAQAYQADFYKIYDAMRFKYPRTEGFPRAGFVAGPCLFKDTMQLASFNNNNFFLGHAAMLINEGLPNFIVNQLKAQVPLDKCVVGILGMAFKGDIDDGRDSLSYKLKKILQFEAKKVLCSDPYVREPDLVGLEELNRQCDVVVLGAPHKCYQNVKFEPHIKVVDVWNFWRN